MFNMFFRQKNLSASYFGEIPGKHNGMSILQSGHGPVKGARWPQTWILTLGLFFILCELRQITCFLCASVSYLPSDDENSIYLKNDFIMMIKRWYV